METTEVRAAQHVSLVFGVSGPLLVDEFVQGTISRFRLELRVEQSPLRLVLALDGGAIAEVPPGDARHVRRGEPQAVMVADDFGL